MRGTALIEPGTSTGNGSHRHRIIVTTTTRHASVGQRHYDHDHAHHYHDADRRPISGRHRVIAPSPRRARQRHDGGRRSQHLSDPQPKGLGPC